MNFKCLPEPDFSQVTVGSEPQPFAGVGGGAMAERRGGRKKPCCAGYELACLCLFGLK